MERKQKKIERGTKVVRAQCAFDFIVEEKRVRKRKVESESSGTTRPGNLEPYPTGVHLNRALSDPFCDCFIFIGAFFFFYYYF